MGASYVIVGRETAPTTGTPHDQGYAHWANAIAFSSAREALPPGCHIEKAGGSATQNRAYCTKGGSILVEAGELPVQGRRSDLDEARAILRSTGSMAEVCDRAKSYAGMRGGELYLKYCEVPRSEAPTVVWLWGPSGSGKTRQAFAEATAPWVSGRDLRWWDGYDGHAHVILDDFRAAHCSFSELLRILDRYPYRVETKGGSRQLRCTAIWITCPFPPERCVPRDEDPRQLMRRITTVIHLGAAAPGWAPPEGPAVIN